MATVSTCGFSLPMAPVGGRSGAVATWERVSIGFGPLQNDKSFLLASLCQPQKRATRHRCPFCEKQMALLDDEPRGIPGSATCLNRVHQKGHLCNSPIPGFRIQGPAGTREKLSEPRARTQAELHLSDRSTPTIEDPKNGKRKTTTSLVTIVDGCEIQFAPPFRNPGFG